MCNLRRPVDSSFQQNIGALSQNILLEKDGLRNEIWNRHEKVGEKGLDDRNRELPFLGNFLILWVFIKKRKVIYGRDKRLREK